MTRRDSALVLALVACLAIVAVLVGAPAFQPVATPPPTDPPVAVAVDRPYREGVLGHPESISPLTARSQADRDLVALLFAGLVRNGPEWQRGPGPRLPLVDLRRRSDVDVRAP